MRKRNILTLFLMFVMTACGNVSYESYTDTIEVNGVNLFYAAEGAGKPVILLHGNGGSHNDLETTHRGLAQAGYMVYALDSRGQGANPRLDEYHYKDMATDVFEFIKAKGLEKSAHSGIIHVHVLRVPLDTDAEGVVHRFQSLNDSVLADRRYPQPSPHLIRRLMVQTVDHPRFGTQNGC